MNDIPEVERPLDSLSQRLTALVAEYEKEYAEQRQELIRLRAFKTQLAEILAGPKGQLVGEGIDIVASVRQLVEERRAGRQVDIQRPGRQCVFGYPTKRCEYTACEDSDYCRIHTEDRVRQFGTPEAGWADYEPSPDLGWQPDDPLIGYTVASGLEDDIAVPRTGRFLGIHELDREIVRIADDRNDDEALLNRHTVKSLPMPAYELYPLLHDLDQNWWGKR